MLDGAERCATGTGSGPATSSHGLCLFECDSIEEAAAYKCLPAVFEVRKLVHERAEKRLGRRYTLGFATTRLTAQRSGPVRPSSVHIEEFATHDDLLANVKDKLKRHGYVLIWWREEFPQLAWLREQGCPIGYRPITTSGIQLQLPLLD